MLEKLRKSHRPLSGAMLAADLGVSRAAVHKRIDKLRAAGHRINGAQRVGYRWQGSADRMDPGTLKGFGASEIVYRRRVGSTQTEAKERAAAGAPEGLLVVAESQTAGRGRRGRRWSSPVGGVWCSLVLRPAVRPDQVPGLTLVAALEWARVMADRGAAARVKWPNDVWVEDCKVAGLLTEMSSETDAVHWVVLGAGVNVNNPVPRGVHPPAAALSRWTGPLDRGVLLSDWMGGFERSYARFVREGWEPFRRAYEKLLLWRGEEVSFDTPEGRRRGRVLGVDDGGRLRVATAAGETRCWGGDVFRVRGAS